MALPNTLRGTYINLLLGDGATPEVFTPVCGLTARGLTKQANTNDQFVRDCADPESVPVRKVIVTGEQVDITGSGLMDRSRLGDMNAAFKTYRNWRYEIDEPATDGVYGGYYSGSGVLTNLELGATDDDFVTVSLSIVSDGAWTFTAA